jgi:uncharacterized protein (DUF697 family)
VLAWASVAPVLAITGWLLVAYPLARLGLATPLLAGPAMLLALAAVVAAARRLPAIEDAPWWSVLATLGVSAAFVAYTAAHSSGHVVLRRDSAVYALLAHWIANRGGVAIPADLEATGGADATIGVLAPGLYPVGDTLHAQFMSGTALTLAPAGWVGGWTSLLAAPAIVGGLALLGVAGLAGRLLGARWAPVAALAVGMTQPVLLTARSAYSEPLALLLLAGALCLLLDAVATRERALGMLAGLAFGFGLLARIDAVRDLALLVPVVAVLALVRHPIWLPLTAGAAVGVGYGITDAFGPARPYLSDLWPALRPGVVAGLGLVALALVAVPVGRRLLTGPAGEVRLPRFGPAVAAAAAAAVLLAVGWLVLRPYVLELTGTGEAAPLVAAMQRAEGLPVQPDRSYGEQSVRWVSWYAGWSALALAAGAVALLPARAVRGEPAARRWALGLGMPLLSALAVLWTPAITPDHPWADRRLVPTVLPVVALLALWAVAAAGRLVRRSADSRWAVALVLAAGLAAVLVPAEHGSRPLRETRTEVGEPAAVEAACRVLGRGDVAVMVDARGRQEWSAPLREVCGVPAVGVPGVETDRTATREEVDAALARIRAAVRRPVLVAQSDEPLPRLTGAVQRQVVDLDTVEHQRSLIGSPRGLAPLSIELWVAVP